MDLITHLRCSNEWNNSSSLHAAAVKCIVLFQMLCWESTHEWISLYQISYMRVVCFQSDDLSFLFLISSYHNKLCWESTHEWISLYQISYMRVVCFQSDDLSFLFLISSYHNTCLFSVSIWDIVDIILHVFHQLLWRLTTDKWVIND